MILLVTEIRSNWSNCIYLFPLCCNTLSQIDGFGIPPKVLFGLMLVNSLLFRSATTSDLVRT